MEMVHATEAKGLADHGALVTVRSYRADHSAVLVPQLFLHHHVLYNSSRIQLMLALAYESARAVEGEKDCA